MLVSCPMSCCSNIKSPVRRRFHLYSFLPYLIIILLCLRVRCCCILAKGATPSNAINNKKNASLYKFGKKEISFIIKKISENEFYIWPSVCPHEGAPLEDANFCDNSVKCPWHGLSFNAVKLSLKNKSISKYGFIYTLDKDYIKISNDNSKN